MCFCRVSEPRRARCPSGLRAAAPFRFRTRPHDTHSRTDVSRRLYTRGPPSGLRRYSRGHGAEVDVFSPRLRAAPSPVSARASCCCFISVPHAPARHTRTNWRFSPIPHKSSTVTIPALFLAGTAQTYMYFCRASEPRQVRCPSRLRDAASFSFHTRPHHTPTRIANNESKNTNSGKS